MSIQTIGRLVYRSRLFTTPGEVWPVPANISRGPTGDAVMWADGCGGGAGGGGGNATPGGGGGGGGPAFAFKNEQFAVVPGESLTITVGAGSAGGAPGSAGATPTTGDTAINGTYVSLWAARGHPGSAGASPNGGQGGGVNNLANPGPGGGAGVGTDGTYYGVVGALYAGGTHNIKCRYISGAAGGALNNNGGKNPSVDGSNYTISAAGGGAAGGGGGAGGGGPFGKGGAGGTNGAAGSNATGYGAGGGGGSGNAAGGNGSNGFVRLYWWEWV